MPGRTASVLAVILGFAAAACVTPPGGGGPPAAGPGIPTNRYVMPDNIPGGPVCDAGMPDVSAQIQAWLDSLPNGATAVFPPGRCYRTELPIMIRARTNFTIDGRGSKLQAFTDGCEDQSNDGINFNHCRYTAPLNAFVNRWPRNRGRFYIKGNRGVVIRNISVDGGHPRPGPDGDYIAEYEAQHAFDLSEDNDGVTIENVRADRVYGDYVYVTGSRNVTVQNSAFGEDNGVGSGNGRQGITVVDGTNIVVRNNRIMNVRRSSVDIEPLSTGAVIRDIFVEDNVFGRSRFNWFANHPYGTADPIIENLYFRNNVLQGEPLSIDVAVAGNPDPRNPATYRRRNYQFINNTSNMADGSPHGSLVRITGVDGVVLRGNSTRVQGGRTPPMGLAEFNKSRNIQVIENSTVAADRSGRYVTSANGAPLVNDAFCERRNRVGSPLTERPDPALPVCP